MKGLLKTKSAGNQFLLLVSIALVSFFLVGLIGTVILSVLTGMDIKDMSDMAKWDYSKPSTITFIRGMQIIQFVSLFLIPTFICARLFSTDTKKYLGLRQPSARSYWIISVLVLILAIPFVQWLGELNRGIRFPSGIEHWMKAKETEANKTVMALLSRQTIKDLILNIICIAGLAAVGEELLFRGMAQRLLVKMFRSHWLGIIIAAFLFSAMHLQFYGFFPRLVLGILLGVVYWYSGSLWTAILAHFVYDALLITLAYFNPAMLNEEAAVKLSSIALTAAISFIMMALAVNWMIKNSRTYYSEVYADDKIPVKDHPF